MPDSRRSSASAETAMAATLPAPAGSALAANIARVRHSLEEEGLVCLVLALLVWRLASGLPEQIVSDGWLALVSGREIVQHGLPVHDALTVWGHGRDWIDQQWLAQLVFYALYAIGGLKLLSLLHLVLTCTAAALALVAARRLGASSRATTWIGAPAVFLVGWGSWNVRPQSLVYILFVALLWLLARDSREPSRRVFLFVPLLLLWANLHGSALLAACLVVLHGLAQGFERYRRRATVSPIRVAALLVLPLLCLFASPYGLDVATYYRTVLLNPDFSRFVVEWDATTLTVSTAPFFILVLAALWLLGRSGRALTTFEKAALVVTAFGGFTALRSVIWFAFTAIVLLPVALEATLRPAPLTGRLRRANLAIGLVAVLVAVASPLAAASQTRDWYARDYPGAAADAVAKAAQAAPSARILANEAFGDWLLLARPELRGRVAYDARFELLSQRRLQEAFAFRTRTGDWQRVARGFDVFVLEGDVERGTRRALLASGNTCQLHAGDIVVLARGPAAKACT